MQKTFKVDTHPNDRFNSTSKMMRTVYIQTHGCQMNEYDSDKIYDLLQHSDGITRVDDPQNADILILNTCSVREKAQEKVFSELGRWRLLKKEKPNTIIGVGGCVASQEGDTLLKRAPYVDVIFGPQTLHRLPQMIKSSVVKRKAVCDISFPAIEKFDNLPPPRTEGVCAFVSIMEGCSKYCSFCIVPYTRGEEISRPLESILTEIKQLSEQGVREITLLGQNVNGYRYTKDGEYTDFSLLLYYVAAIDNIDRIRYTTSHPIEFNDALIQAHAELPQLASHLHLPVQSGSDRVLVDMKRGYTSLEYKSIVRKLKQARPDISLSSDFIIGFPGESEAEFEQTMDLIEHIGYDQSFSFLYSKRPGTPAADLPDDTSLDVKKQRLSILQERINQMAHDISHNMVGNVYKVLMNDFSKKSKEQLQGRTENNRVVNLNAPPEMIGQFVDVKITEALRNSLRGEVV